MDTPNKDWSLDQLGKFVVAAGRRSAVDVWHMGNAILLASEKAGKGFNKWMKGIGISRPTAFRYKKIAEKFTLEQAQDKPLWELYDSKASKAKKKDKAAAKSTGKKGILVRSVEQKHAAKHLMDFLKAGEWTKLPGEEKLKFNVQMQELRNVLNEFFSTPLPDSPFLKPSEIPDPMAGVTPPVITDEQVAAAIQHQ